jgi:hypothetical protein
VGIVEEVLEEIKQTKDWWLGKNKEEDKGTLRSIQVYSNFIPTTSYIKTRWENCW